MKVAKNILVGVAILFGLLTIVAGSRVLLGADPGYLVYRPLLIYNTIMGFVYVLAGVIAWRKLKHGMFVAAAIFTLNLVVATALSSLYLDGGPVAVDSVRAMTLRTIVWLVLFSGFGWLSSKMAMRG